MINCESCMQWHIEQAALAGAVEPEVLEAIEVGMEMGGGPATAHARFALEVMASVFTAFVALSGIEACRSKSALPPPHLR